MLDTLKPIWVRTPQTASRVRARIAATFDYAKAKGFRSGENPAAWKGHLEHILPRRQKVEQPHFQAMPYREIPAFVASLREHTDGSHLAIEFLILTACRSAEARAATWQEIDLARAAWTLPPARTKTGTVHTVPLAPRAVAILRKVAGEHRSLVPGQCAGRPIASSSLHKILPPGVTLRGFRSAFRDWCAEQTNFPRELCEEALATIGNATERAYRRTDLLERRRELMALWASTVNPQKHRQMLP